MSVRQGTWHLEGYDGLQKFWEGDLKAYQFTPLQIDAALKMLVASHLTHEEVFASLDPASETNFLGITEQNGVKSCGENPHYTARRIS